MTVAYETAGAAVIIFWVVFRIARWAVADRIAAALAAAVTVALLTVLADSAITLMIVAVLAPFGAMLPILAGANILAKFGRPVDRFSTVEILLALIFVTLFLAASIGALPFDPYRFGYDPLPAGAVALALCLWALWRGHVTLALAAVLGQVMWMTDTGSTNYFDHVSHMLLVPVLAITLLLRLVGMLRPARPAPDKA
ncbi:hypothetical protein [Shimia sp. SDUM112013]|uniref:hypothetical protein n=1 Tax=Shimia sp. SDUM112013 TaxID=3136160 RepID=UPI0032EB008E